MHVRRVGHRDLLTGMEAADGEHRVALVDRDRTLVPLARRHHHEAAAGERVVEVSLLVARLDAVRVGEHPHLHEMHVGGRAGVHLRVADARARAHPLGEAGVDHAVGAGAGAVAVAELAVEHPGHDLHVAVAVRPESATGADGVVVVDDQEPVTDVARVVVRPEAEAVPGVEPVEVGVESAARGAHVDGHSRSMPARSQRAGAMELRS